MTRDVTRRSVVIAAICAGGTLLAAAQAGSRVPPKRTAITENECTPAALGTSIPASAIGEPVSGVTLSPPQWVAATPQSAAYCRVDGAMAPVDTAATSRPINFRVVLPASWNERAAQIGGGGMNGVIPNLAGVDGTTGVSPLQLGFVTYGSDSGHQAAPFGPRGGGAAAPVAAAQAPAVATGPAPNTSPDWTLNDEAIRNIGYMQIKKTHDAAMVIVERAYGGRPQFNYFFGTSQGGREALTAAQRYADDYDGVIANVPIVSFSSLMLAPEWIRIQEKPAANWVPRAKVAAIRAEFIRQCDALDGVADGINNNYMACRAIFDVKDGGANVTPWASRRCPNNVDPNPADTSASACLTDGQIKTLNLVYSRYSYASPLSNGVSAFGMWVPTTDPSGSGLITDTRYRGQDGAAANAPMHTHLGILGVTGFLMRNLEGNPLDYVEGGNLENRRHQLSEWLDSTNPNLRSFSSRGGKMIVTIGTDDTLASPGAQLDYYQAVIDRMGRAGVDQFARFFVLPQTNHGLRGMSAATAGDGRAITPAPIPSTYDRLKLLQDWVERKTAPPMFVTVTAGDRSLPMCSYPAFPNYVSGPPTDAASYACVAK